MKTLRDYGRVLYTYREAMTFALVAKTSSEGFFIDKISCKTGDILKRYPISFKPKYYFRMLPNMDVCIG